MIRHRHLILAIRAEEAVSGCAWVGSRALVRRVLEAFGDLGEEEKSALDEGSVEADGVRDCLEMMRDLAADGNFLEMRRGAAEGALECRLTETGRKMAGDLMGK